MCERKGALLGLTYDFYAVARYVEEQRDDATEVFPTGVDVRRETLAREFKIISLLYVREKRKKLNWYPREHFKIVFEYFYDGISKISVARLPLEPRD